MNMSISFWWIILSTPFGNYTPRLRPLLIRLIFFFFECRIHAKGIRLGFGSSNNVHLNWNRCGLIGTCSSINEFLDFVWSIDSGVKLRIALCRMNPSCHFGNLQECIEPYKAILCCGYLCAINIDNRPVSGNSLFWIEFYASQRSAEKSLWMTW